jgi:ABC-type lipoprotein release transport system permease subunit
VTPFRLSILNITRRKFTSAIAIVSIALSVACSGILLRAYEMSSSRFSTIAKSGDAVVGAKNSGIEIFLGAMNNEGPYPDFVPYVLFESLRKEAVSPGVYASSKLRAVTPFLYFGKYKDYRIIGTDESFISSVNGSNMNIESGRWAENEGELVIGHSVYSKEKLNIGDVININPWISDKKDFAYHTRNLPFKIVGVFSETKTSRDYALYSGVLQAQNVIRGSNSDSLKISIWGASVLSYYIVYMNPDGKDAFVNLINKRTIAQVIYPSEELIKLEEIMSAGKNMGMFITFLIILLAGLAIAAIMTSRFDSMKLQIAVLRAIGYRKKEIALWLIWEGLLLGILACVLGAIIDVCLMPLLISIIKTGIPENASAGISVFASYPVWIITVFATVAASFLPVFKIYKQDIHRALRSV